MPHRRVALSVLQHAATPAERQAQKQRLRGASSSPSPITIQCCCRRRLLAAGLWSADRKHAAGAAEATAAADQEKRKSGPARWEEMTAASW